MYYKDYNRYFLVTCNISDRYSYIFSNTKKAIKNISLDNIVSTYCSQSNRKI